MLAVRSELLEMFGGQIKRTKIKRITLTLHPKTSYYLHKKKVCTAILLNSTRNDLENFLNFFNFVLFEKLY